MTVSRVRHHCTGMKSKLLGTTLLGMFVFGCSGSSAISDGSGGTASGIGGTGTGGAPAAGGTIASTGGAPVATGGSATGGANASTGGKAAGGTSSSTGGRAAGGSGVGGAATGGANPGGGQATGGKGNPGGGQASGGVAYPGGGQASGGVANPGGGQATGGKANPGGGQATGGQVSSGGASTSVAGASTSSGCGKAPTIASSQYNNGSTIAITAASMQRRYILSVPTNYDNAKPYKLIIAIHQLDGNDKQMYSQKYYGLQSLTNDTTIFVAPNGQKSGAPCSGTGNGDSGCGWPNSSGGDMALMDAVVAQVEANFCIDTNRIFATGWSYGASMSYEVGCQRPLGGTGSASWGVRGIAIYSGAQMSGSCKPSTPIAFYGSHGTNDNVLGYDGGVKLAQNMAQASGCTWATPTKATGAHVCTNEAGCKAGYPAEFCSFVGPHTPFPDTGSSANTWQPPVVWAFFNQF